MHHSICQIAKSYSGHYAVDITVWQQQKWFEGLKISPISIKIKEKLNQCAQHRYVTCTSTALCSGNSLLHACKYIMHLSCKNYQAYYFEYFGKKKKLSLHVHKINLSQQN